MATVFMKWLETSPKDYDRGIQILTLGRLQRLEEKIVRDYVHEGTRVLEIGCGTGMLTALIAREGAIVTGIDASPTMLAEAQKKVAAGNLQERVTLKHMDAALIEDRFAPASFDWLSPPWSLANCLPTNSVTCWRLAQNCWRPMDGF